MKYRLELNCVEDGRKFLNFWDGLHGKDVVCQIVDGKLILFTPIDDDSDLLSDCQFIETEVSLTEFIEAVEATDVAN